MQLHTNRQLIDYLQEESHAQQAEIVGIRRHLHQYPELSFEEQATAAYVAGWLSRWQIPFKAGVGGYGLVGLIEGQAGKGACIALRADMDALPIEEANMTDYRSRHAGVMHACGHDVHTASLLGAARLLQQLRQHFRGSIKLLFQPAEEKTPGGASLMIRDGALKAPAPAAIIGQHVHPPLACGRVGFRPGIFMASTDELYLRVQGRGGHGAIPQDTIDPIAITAQIITALQQLVSRRADPTIPSVLTFGHIASTGGSTNVIPREVKLKGTFRTLDEPWRAEAHRLMQQMAEGIAAAMGAQAELIIDKGYPFLKNDELLTERLRSSARAYLGDEQVVELPIRMTGEDFAWYTHELPGCFYRLGTGNPAKGIVSQVHTDTFDVDEDCFYHSTGLMAWLALQELNHRNQG
jgi:amidohydrolase